MITGAATASSIAASMVQRPSPLSSTSPANSFRSGDLASAMAVRSSSQEATTLPRRQTSAMSAVSSVEALVFRQLVAGAAAQNVEAFGIGLHQAIFDAVMDHLDEMARARRPGMHIALADARIAAFAARRLVDSACARRQRREDRIEPVHRHPCRRRSSCNSRAPGPTRRPRCRNRHRRCSFACSALARRISSL